MAQYIPGFKIKRSKKKNRVSVIISKSPQYKQVDLFGFDLPLKNDNK